MGRHLPKIAAMLLLAAAVVVITRNRAPHPTHQEQGAAAAVPMPSRTGTRRPTLEEALPVGAVITRDAGAGGVRVELPDGSLVTAAGVSVTDGGVSFESPYRVERPSLLPMSCSDGQTSLVLSADGKTFRSVGRTEWKGEFGIDFEP